MKALKKDGEKRNDGTEGQKRRIIIMISVAAAAIILLAALALGIYSKIRDGREGTAGTAALSGAVSRNEDGQENTSGAKGQEVPQYTQTAEEQEAGENIQETDGQGTVSESQKADAQGALDDSRQERPQVKGIYVTGPMAGNAAFENLLALVDETELNTMVIDVKNDEGNITFDMNLDSVQEAGACIPYIRDMEELMATLKEHEVYTIARVVCFKDPYLAQYRPELALKKPDGTPVTDANGLAWVNPYKEGVWEYLTEIAQQAELLGFDEVQFDYVRFPIGSDADAADYGVDTTEFTRQQAITGFLDYVTQKLQGSEMLITADVFGTIIGSDTDTERTGQDYALLGEKIDVLCPMVYPSHYANHVFGLEVPDAHPYDTVYAALTDSQEELAEVPEQKRAAVRPWLQAFTATWIKGHISYGGEQIRQQIQAVYDAGYEEWILWNASNRYSADGLLPEN